MAPILRKASGMIDWNRPASEIVNRVRAFVPWPGSHTGYTGTPWKVTGAKVGEGNNRGEAPGTVLRVDGDSLLIAADGSAVRILSVQLPGKRSMAVQDFLNGHPVQTGAVLGADEAASGR